MTKKHFIALADAIRDCNAPNAKTNTVSALRFSNAQIEMLADFCESQNPFFDRSRWLAYIAGKCGSNGGAVKA